jgi:hypothetical protein
VTLDTLQHLNSTCRREERRTIVHGIAFPEWIPSKDAFRR